MVHNESSHTAEERVRSPHEPPRAGFEDRSPRSPNPRRSWPSPRPASSRFAAGRPSPGPTERPPCRPTASRATVRPWPRPPSRTDAGAAFFDLDRTLLSGASGPAISAALRAVGLMSDRSIPGQDLVFRVFNMFGENLPSMMLTRQAASLAAGWPRDGGPARPGDLAAETLIDLVQPYAKVLIDEHHAAGRLVVLATTTPYDLVKPLADLLGFDAVIATRYGERDGVYTGTHRRRVRVEPRQVPGRAGVGRRARRLARRELRLLRQLLRRAAAQRGRATRSSSTPTRGCASRRWPGAGRPSTSTCRRACRSWSGSSPSSCCSRSCGPGWRPTPSSDVGHRAHPGRGPGHHLRQPPQLLRRRRAGLRRSPSAADPCASSARRRSSTRRSSATWPGRWAASASSGARGSDEPLHEALAALEAGEMVALMPQGTIPRGGRSSTPC